MQLRHDKALIANLFPQRTPIVIDPLAEGQFNQVYLVDNRWIVRIPRFAGQLPLFRIEVKALQVLAPLSPLKIPAILDFNVEHIDTAFMRYRRIEGQPLTPALYAVLPANIQIRLVRELAAFTGFLHAVSDPVLVEILPEEDTPGYWQNFYQRVTIHLIPEMSRSGKEKVSRRFDSFLESTQNHQIPLSVRHGDLGPSNILFDPLQQTISGIIDFSSIALGDPAADYASLSCLGWRFWDLFCEKISPSAELFNRVEFYRWTFPLQEALAGFENNDPESYQDGMKNFI